MASAIDITGQKFNMLTAIKKVDSDIRGASRWLFECDCGNTKEIKVASVRSGRTKACGCKQDRTTHGMSRTHTYKCWTGMKQRCLNPKAPDYENYGGRGIIICAEWVNSFEAFYKDVGVIPDNMEIERINSNRDYEKNNIKLANRAEQMQNTRRSKRWTLYGITYNSATEASKDLKMSKSQIRRMCNGYTHANGNYHPPKDGCYSELVYTGGA